MTDIVTEVEIENPVNVEPEEKKPQKTIPVIRKRVADLNDKEKEDIMAIYNNGGEHPDYNVRMFKNGNKTITLKKKKAEPVSSQLLKDDIPRTDKKVHLSDNQLLMEHVMDLQIKCEKLMSKHKKMKKRLAEYEQYEDFDETPIPETISKPEVEKQEEEIPKREEKPAPIPTKGNRSWRAHVSYL
jgi:hypothetical protein